MAVEIIMPKAGMAMEEGTIVKWLKEEGDEVKEGDILLEILTDKVNMEVEAESAGYLLKKIREEGEVLPVFTVIGYIGAKGEKITEKAEATQEKMNGTSETKEEVKEESVFHNKHLTAGDGNLRRATPAARKAAVERGLSLGEIEGTGPKGRIQKADVYSYKESGVKASPLAKKISESEGIDLSKVSGTGVDGKIFKRDLTLTGEEATEEIVPLTGIRKVIAERMSESYFTVPAFTLNIEVEVSKLLELKDKAGSIIKEETGEKLTINDILILVVSRAVEKYMGINVSLLKEGIKYNREINVGMAVSANGILTVPVLKRASKKSLKEIVKEGKELIRKAREGKLTMEEQSGSTITISNLGMYGVHYFNPIINQPNSSIIGAGTIEEKLFMKDGNVGVKKVMYLSSTFDHRVIDGSLGAEFMQYVKQLCEDPYMLLI